MPRPAPHFVTCHAPGAEPSQVFLGSRHLGLPASSVLSSSVCTTRPTTAKMMCGAPSATMPATAETQEIADKVRLGLGQQEQALRGPSILRNRLAQIPYPLGPAAGFRRDCTCGWEVGLRALLEDSRRHWAVSSAVCMVEGRPALRKQARDRRHGAAPKSSGR